MNEPRSDLDIDGWLPRDAGPRLRRFAGYWLGLREPGTIPAFSDIDPIDIAWALSDIYVLRPDGEADFIFRLVGESVSQRYNRSLKGRRISELYAEATAGIIRSRWHRVIRETCICYTHTAHDSSVGGVIDARRVILPLADDGKHADHVIGIAEFSGGAAGETPRADGATLRQSLWLPVPISG